MTELQNANPVIFNVSRVYVDTNIVDFENEDDHEEITAQEIFEHIRHLNDPEHPLTLVQFVFTVQNGIKIFSPYLPMCTYFIRNN